MKHLLTILLLLGTLVPLKATTYYIDYSAGSDSNSGISTSTAWKRAPGMKGFGGAYRHAAGDRFIFKGGVTWPSSVLQLRITAGGSSNSTRDYYGVDQAWFAGSAWSRPVFDFEDTQLSIGWQYGAGVLFEYVSFITFDNIELKRHRSFPNGFDHGASTLVLYGNCSFITIQNCYVHDWSIPLSGPGQSGGGEGGVTQVNGYGDGIVIDRCEFSQANALGGQSSGAAVHLGGTVSNCVIHDTASAILGSGSFRNNHIYNLRNPSDPLAHSNAIYTFYPSVIANNVIHDTQSSAQVIYSSPNFTGAAGYDLIYNNLVYNTAQPCIAIDEEGPDGSKSGARIYNNTLVGPGGAGICIRVAGRQKLGVLDARNNHLIADRNPICISYAPGFCGDVIALTLQNNLLQTTAQANAAGYNQSNGYRPLDTSKPTAGAGQDFSGVFSTDLFGVSRTAPWDIGAYEITTSGGVGGGGGGGSAGSPGTFALGASTYTVNEAAGTLTIAIRRTGGTTGTAGCSYTTANGTAASGVNYAATSGALAWGIGDSSDRNIVVPILNVSTVGDKSFTFTLSNATGGSSFGSPSSATITINGTGTAPTTPPASQPPPSGSGLANSSFESGTTGWTVSGNQGIASSGLYTPSEGSKLVAFNWGQTTPNGFVSQAFSSTAGQTYILTFDVGIIAFNQSEQRMQITVQGNATLLSKVIPLTGTGTGVTKWAPQSLSFVADGATTTLSFQDVSPTSLNLDLLLDNVKVVAQSGPLTVSQPANVTVNPGESATFSVTASGSATLAYQWRFNNTPIPGATSSSYSISSVQSANAGAYDVVVTSGASSVTSSAASLALTQAINFTNGSFESGYTGWTQSGYQSVVQNSTYKPSDGSKVVVFNWGQTPPTGILSQTFTTVSGQSYSLNFDVGIIAYNLNEQRLQVTVQGTGQLLSRTLSLFGLGNGIIKWNPQTFTFVADSSSTTLRFQDVSPGTQNLDLMLDNVRISADQVTGTTITSQPASMSVNAGDTATFSVSASGPANLTYQWRFNGNPVAGATASTYTILNVQVNYGGNYDVVISGGPSPVTSATAALSVTAPITFINGSFESGSTGWTRSGFQSIATAGTPFPAAQGSKLVVFNAGDMPPNGILSQSFATAVGQKYNVTCSVGVLAYNLSESRMQITVQGSSQLFSQVVSLFGIGGGTARWSSQSFSFVANSATTILTFRDVSPATSAIDLLLDNVQVSLGN